MRWFYWLIGWWLILLCFWSFNTFKRWLWLWLKQRLRNFETLTSTLNLPLTLKIWNFATLTSTFKLSNIETFTFILTAASILWNFDYDCGTLEHLIRNTINWNKQKTIWMETSTNVSYIMTQALSVSTLFIYVFFQSHCSAVAPSSQISWPSSLYGYMRSQQWWEQDSKCQDQDKDS